VSLTFLLQFAREFSVKAEEKTFEVCQRLIVPHTARHECCYFSMLKAGVDEGTESPWAAKQTIFVSHSWGCTFWSLLKTLANYEEEFGPQYYYVDLFGLNQHDLAKIMVADADAQAAKAKELLATLDNAIKTANSILVAIDQWDSPAPLARIWCLYELWRGCELQKPIKAGFPHAAAVRFAKAVRDLEADVDHIVLDKVDVRRAQATKEEDLKMIQTNIETTVGQDTFNNMLRDKLMAHFVHCAIHTRITDEDDMHGHGHRTEISMFVAAVLTSDCSMDEIGNLKSLQPEPDVVGKSSEEGNASRVREEEIDIGIQVAPDLEGPAPPPAAPTPIVEPVIEVVEGFGGQRGRGIFCCSLP